MKQIEVVAAIIHDNEGRIFATQRGYGDYKDGWEFPGGKMEDGETPEEALKREIWEELETRIVVERLVQTVEYDYPQFHLTMHCFWCHVESGSLTRSIRLHVGSAKNSSTALTGCPPTKWWLSNCRCT